MRIIRETGLNAQYLGEHGYRSDGKPFRCGGSTPSQFELDRRAAEKAAVEASAERKARDRAEFVERTSGRERGDYILLLEGNMRWTLWHWDGSDWYGFGEEEPGGLVLERSIRKSAGPITNDDLADIVKRIDDRRFSEKAVT